MRLPRSRLLPLLLVLLAATGRARAEPPQRVAVLPFKALTSGQKEWIGAGIAESLITTLSALPDLRVVERAQLHALQAELRLIAQAKKESDEDAGAVKIGKLLGASRLVIGSFQMAGGEILINGRFVNTQTGVIAETFQLRGKAERLFDLYPRLTERALKTLGLRPPAAEAGKAREAYVAAQAPPASLTAQELYVQGREAALQGTAAGLRKAATVLQQATMEDPNYALAYAALSEVQSQIVLDECGKLAWLVPTRRRDPQCHLPSREPAQDELAQRAGFQDRADAYARTYAEADALRTRCQKNSRLALASATTAVSLQPALPAAHRALGLAHWAAGDRQKAEVEARTVLNLNRSDSFGYYLLGLCTTEADESRGFHRRSMELDPLLLANYYELAVWSFNENGEPGEKDPGWGKVPRARPEKEAEALAIAEQGLKQPGALPELHALRAALLLRRAALGKGRPQAGELDAAQKEIDAVLRAVPEHREAQLMAALVRWWRGGPERPWQAREAWQDAAALHLFRSRLWEPKVCHDPAQRQPVDTFDFGLPERLLRGGAWVAWKAAITQITRHLDLHDSDLKDPPRFCAGSPARKGGVLFLDTRTQSRVVARWDQGMLLRSADPAAIDRWWEDRSWNQVVFEVVVCADPPVGPDDELRVELLFDGKAQPVWKALGPDGREDRKWTGASDWNTALGSAPAFSRPRGEFRLRGRFLYAPLRKVLQDGSEHEVRVRVRRDGRLVGEGRVPFQLHDTAEFKE